MRRLALFAAIAATTLAVGACGLLPSGPVDTPSPTAAPSPSPSPESDATAAALEHDWEDSPEQRFFRESAFFAEVDGAGQLQVDALLAAAEAGVLTYYAVEALYEPFFACLTSVGAVGMREDDVEIAPGFYSPDYTVRIPHTADPEQTERLAYNCELEYVAFMWPAMFQQPAASAAEEQAILDRRDDIEDCLREGGYEPTGEENIGELNAAVFEVFVATEQWCLSV